MNEPLLSVIIPTYNSEETLEKTLTSLRMQTIPQEQMEILIIDGGSTDSTLEIAKKYNTIILDNHAIRYKDITLLAHFMYTYITFFYIVFYMLRKWLGFKDKNTSYG